MEIEEFTKFSPGKLIRDDRGFYYFLPQPLPPEIEWSDEMASLLSGASSVLGELAGLGRNIREPNLLIYPFIRKEAVLSSRIEGTVSSFSDLIKFESLKIKEEKDVEEVNNYVRALEYGLEEMKVSGISLDFILDIHRILMENVRGEKANPGKFRDGRVWIGRPGSSIMTAEYVPPAPEDLNEALENFQKYLTSENSLPAIINAALIHYQFEAIHPFFDGNGRIGRLLIIFYLHREGLLPRPYLYLSSYFEKNRSEYYNLLLRVSQKNVWEEWIFFFLRGIIKQSKEVIEISEKLINIQDEYRRKIHTEGLSPTAGEVLEVIFKKPIININFVAEEIDRTYQAVNKAIGQLVDIGILEEITGDRRNRVFRAPKILEILEE